MAKRVHKKIDWTPEDRARHKALREKFQRDKPSPDEVLASGEYVGPVPQGIVFDVLELLAGLRQAREQTGLTLDQVSERSGIDRTALSRLETGRNPNPTLDTLFRYSRALGRRLRLVLEEEGAA